jgi:hypothetical protein
LILFFLMFSISLSNSSFIFCVVILIHKSFYSVLCFTLCLLKSTLCSFICFCVFSCFLFLVSWNFLSASCTFWLTMSSSFSMNFSVISSKISSLRVFMWVSLGSLVTSLFCWGQELSIHFLHFPLNSVLNYFFE